MTQNQRRTAASEWAQLVLTECSTNIRSSDALPIMQVDGVMHAYSAIIFSQKDALTFQAHRTD